MNSSPTPIHPTSTVFGSGIYLGLIRYYTWDLIFEVVVEVMRSWRMFKTQYRTTISTIWSIQRFIFWAEFGDSYGHRRISQAKRRNKRVFNYFQTSFLSFTHRGILCGYQSLLALAWPLVRRPVLAPLNVNSSTTVYICKPCVYGWKIKFLSLSHKTFKN